MLKKDLTSREAAALTEVSDLMDQEWSPCRYHCPVHADVRTYIEHAAEGRWQDAIDVIRENLPFAVVCGRICHHPCETNCRRQDVDAPVAIREVKRFVAEQQGAAGSAVHKAASQDKAKVAVVGGGPAGMAAALDLAKLGYRPTVFEKFPVAGGIPATAIPKYRLPRDVLQIDIDWICAHGVELVTGVEIGKDKSMADLKAEGFEVVLIATGLALSRTLPLPGGDHKRVFPVLDFLTELAFDREPDIGDDVLIIGGGNVAMDAARSAVRMGAKRVRAMCLENAEEMPAWDWERDEAAEEGVEFIFRRGPVEVRIAEENITGLTARKVTRVFDDEGRFAPEYDDSDVISIECDTVVMAIGQMPDHGYAEGSELVIGERGRLTFDSATHQTNLLGIFACGEIVSPPGSVVEACASGQRAAKAIDLHLRGEKIVLDETRPPAIDVIESATAEKVRKVERTPVSVEPPELRRTSLSEIDHNFDAMQATVEARRCMGCGGGAEVLVDKCAACLTCLRVCPFDIPKVTDVARIDSVLCQACGICIAECPANAIIFRSHDVKQYAQRGAAALASLNGAPAKIVAFICGQQASAEEWSGQADDGVAGVAEVYVPSLSGVSTTDLLAAFESGADGVILVASSDDAERYPTATKRMAKRVEQARELLKEIGESDEVVQWCEPAPWSRPAVRDAIAAAAANIAAAQENS